MLLVMVTLMAKILVLQEIKKNSVRLHEALPEHQIVDFEKACDAMQYLRSQSADMIISAVHLEESNVFDFLQWVKGDPAHRDLPFVFFCAEPTEVAKYVSGAITTAARVLGATKYIAQEQFDQAALKQEVNSILRQYLEGTIHDRNAELDRREQVLNDREQALNRREAGLNERNMGVDERERFVERREQASGVERKDRPS